ncbi:MAG: type IV pilus assembly protein PilM [Candidatus Woesearchaeota archaeon]
MFLSFGKKKYVVVDIGSCAIKGAVLKKNKDGLELKAANYRKLPPGIIEDGKIKDKSIVATEIKELFSEMNINPKNVITTIPSNHLVTRNFELPNLPKKELEEALKWELDDVLTYSAEETTFDYIITEKREDKINVLLIAAQDKVIEQYKSVFSENNIKTDVINTQAMALISLLKFQDKLNKATAIVDLGHQGSRVVLCNEKDLFLTRNIDSGGYDFTKNIMDNQNFEYKEAEEYKWENGIEVKNEVGNLEEDISLLGIGNDLVNISKEIAEEVSRSLEFYSIKNRGENIENLYITGGTSLLKGMEKLIEKETSLKTKRIDPFEKIEVNINFDNNYKELFNVVMGLAVSEVMHDES